MNKIKVGSEVVIFNRNGFSIERITGETKLHWIVNKNKYKKSNGGYIHNDCWSNIYIDFNADVAVYKEKQKRINKIRFITFNLHNHNMVSKMSNDHLDEIINIIKNYKIEKPEDVK